MKRLLVMGFAVASLGLTGCQPTKMGTKAPEPVRQSVGGGGGPVRPPVQPPVQPPIRPPVQPPIQQPPIQQPPIVNLPVPPPPGTQLPPQVNIPPQVNYPPVQPQPIPTQQPPTVNIPPTVQPPPAPPQVYNPPTINIPPSTPQNDPPVTVNPPVRPPVVEWYEIPPINPQTEPPPCTPGVNCPPTQVNLPPVPPREDQTIVPPTVTPTTSQQPVRPVTPATPATQSSLPIGSSGGPMPSMNGGMPIGRGGGGGVLAMKPQGSGGVIPSAIPQAGGTSIVQPPVATQPRVSLSSIPERNDINELEMFPSIKPAPKASPVSVTEVSYPTPKILDKTCEPQKLDSEMESEQLDLLIGVDTSASMTGGLDSKSAEFKSGGELGRFLRGLPTFVRQLDVRADVNIAVILGHGPKSPQYHGKLYKAPGETSAVIKMSEAKNGCKGSAEEIRECALSKISKLLEVKVKAISYARDMSDAQGEAIQLSVYNLLMDESNLKLARGQEFLRKKATLAFVPVADENDVCFDYGDESKFKPAQVEIKDAKGKVTGKGRDPYEKRFFDEVCMKAADGHQFSYANLWDALLRLKEGNIDKLVITPLIYINNDMPMGVEDENEMGLGHYQLAVDLAHQPVADLGAVDRSNDSVAFANQLKFLGQFTSFRMKYANIFQCSTDVHPSSVNQSSVKVEVIDKKTGQPIATFSGACTAGGECPADGLAQTDIGMNGDGKHPFVRVSVPYETLAGKLSDKKFEDGEVRIKFKTRSNVDQVTGVTVPSKETSLP